MARSLLVAVTLLALAAQAPLEPGAGERGVSLEAARRLFDEFKYGAAREMAAELLVEMEREHGAETLEVAAVLDLLVGAGLKAGQWRDPELRLHADRAVRIRTMLQGEDHPDLAGSLGLQGDVVRASGDYEGAIAIWRRALEIRERRLGPRHPEVATTLYELSRLLVRTERPEEGTQHLRRALEIREAALGGESPLVAEVLETLALALPTGEAAKEAHLRRALEIREAAQGPDHPDVARSLSYLGSFLRGQSKYVEAGRLHERSLEIVEKAFGPDDFRMALASNRLAVTLQMRGDIARARPLYERSLRIRETLFGPEHPDVAAVLNNLGIVYNETGNYARARQLFERSLEIRRKKLGNEDRDVAGTLNNLGLVLDNQGAFVEARRVHEEALAIRRKLSGAEGAVAQSLYNIAVLGAELGDRELARNYLEQALELQIKTWGPEHGDVGLTQMSLGSLVADAGDLDRSVQLLLRALNTLKKTVGPGNVHVPRTGSLLAAAYRKKGRATLALDTALEAAIIAREQFRNNTRAFSENEALQFGSARTSAMDVALTILEDAAGLRPDAPDRVFDQLIRSRALVLDEMATRQLNFLREAPELEALAGRLEEERERLARLAVVGFSTEPPEDYAQQLELARKATELAEQRLAEQSRSFRERLERFAVGLQEVAAALPRSAALVAYAHFRRGGGATSGEIGVGGTTSAYLAFVLRGGEKRPRIVRLGDAAPIDDLVRRWRAEVVGAPPVLPVAARLAEQDYRDVALALRRAVWDRIAPAVADKDLVLVVPDATLHRLSLVALPRDAGGYLAEGGARIHYLSAERDLVAEPTARPRGRGLLALGGPDFDRPPQSFAVPEESGQARPVRAALEPARGWRATCGELRARHFLPLPGAGAEATQIAALWAEKAASDRTFSSDTLLLTGSLAREAAVKSYAPGRRIIHIATHGFFASEDCRSLLRPSHTHAPRAAEVGPGLTTLLENPLLQSGLAFAGANQREELGPDSEADDGMLTSQEIASLDLSGAEWVVLSACETGVGRVQAGEGVLGLRRAFEIAGAGALIMSLWEVKDEATREWMVELYTARLNGVSTADAVHRANRATIERRRVEGLSTHPFYWGAFVAAGDWR